MQNKQTHKQKQKKWEKNDVNRKKNDVNRKKMLQKKKKKPGITNSLNECQIFYKAVKKTC